MTDLEITRLCAEAMEYEAIQYWNVDEVKCYGDDKYPIFYKPIRDDAQAMALVKKFPRLCIDAMSMAQSFCGTGDIADFNRAICECVAKMQTSE